MLFLNTHILILKGVWIFGFEFFFGVSADSFVAVDGFYFFSIESSTNFASALGLFLFLFLDLHLVESQISIVSVVVVIL